MPQWWELVNEKLGQTKLQMRFVLNKDGKVEINPPALPSDYEDTRLFFEIVDDVFAILEEAMDAGDEDEPNS